MTSDANLFAQRYRLERGHDWVYAEENGFVLEPNVKVPVNIVLNVPEGVEMGDYDGYIIVYFKRVLFS